MLKPAATNEKSGLQDYSDLHSELRKSKAMVFSIKVHSE
jgi:hypothetical protein